MTTMYILERTTVISKAWVPDFSIILVHKEASLLADEFQLKGKPDPRRLAKIATVVSVGRVRRQVHCGSFPLPVTSGRPAPRDKE